MNATRTNIDRAADAMVAVERYVAADCGNKDDLRASITDLMVDLLHLGQREGMDPWSLSQRALSHYKAETR